MSLLEDVAHEWAVKKTNMIKSQEESFVCGAKWAILMMRRIVEPLDAPRNCKLEEGAYASRKQIEKNLKALTSNSQKTRVEWVEQLAESIVASSSGPNEL